MNQNSTNEIFKNTDENIQCQKNQETCLPKMIKAIVIGAGYRGRVYSRYATEFPNELKIVGIAEPRTNVRNKMKNTFEIPEIRCFGNWESACQVDKFADCVFICTQDQNHVGPAIAFAKKGYHILLEKPMAVTVEDCRMIYETCEQNKVILSICHVLRYHPSVRKLKEIIDTGLIGEVVNISHTEPVGYWHFAHSFVRGNWGNESRSTFSLLSKCCHDVDLLCYWMSNQKCIKVSSFGSLLHFKKENKPSNAGQSCLECKAESTCPYSAKKIYLDRHDPEKGLDSFPLSALCDVEDSDKECLEQLTEAIKTGPYGKCVYDTDNDVCDNQVVNFQYDSGATATLTMIAFSKEICKRKTTIYGTKGELNWDDFDRYTVRHFDFLAESSHVYTCEEENPGWGHGGSDFFIIQSFIRALAYGNSSLITTGPKESLNSHLLTFAAEHSRKTGHVIDFRVDSQWQL